MSEFLLPTLGPHSYKAPVRKIDGFSSYLLLADIEPQRGRITRGYVKTYPPGSRGLVNEIIKWLVATALHQPQPPEAYVLLMHVDVLASYWPHINWAEHTDCDMYPSFCSVAIDGLTPKTSHAALRLDALINDLMQWDKLFAAIAMHEFLADADANISNLVRLSKGRWAMLDGGQILGGHQWTPATLKTLDWIHNKLLHLLYPTGQPPDDAKQQIVASSRQHNHALEAAMPYIMHWLIALCGIDDAAAAKHTLNRRACPHWMARRFGLKTEP